jgi:hypothetical protein
MLRKSNLDLAVSSRSAKVSMEDVHEPQIEVKRVSLFMITSADGVDGIENLTACCMFQVLCLQPLQL